MLLLIIDKICANLIRFGQIQNLDPQLRFLTSMPVHKRSGVAT